MTPLQAYELAKMFAARMESRSHAIDSMKRNISAPMQDTPAAHRELREMQTALTNHMSALAELHAVEIDARRILGLEQGESDGNQ